jgi:hypothetical protein
LMVKFLLPLSRLPAFLFCSSWVGGPAYDMGVF